MKQDQIKQLGLKWGNNFDYFETFGDPRKLGWIIVNIPIGSDIWTKGAKLTNCIKRRCTGPSTFSSSVGSITYTNTRYCAGQLEKYLN